MQKAALTTNILWLFKSCPKYKLKNGVLNITFPKGVLGNLPLAWKYQFFTIKAVNCSSQSNPNERFQCTQRHLHETVTKIDEYQVEPLACGALGPAKHY